MKLIKRTSKDSAHKYDYQCFAIQLIDFCTFMWTQLNRFSQSCFKYLVLITKLYYVMYIDRHIWCSIYFVFTMFYVFSLLVSEYIIFIHSIHKLLLQARTMMTSLYSTHTVLDSASGICNSQIWILFEISINLTLQNSNILYLISGTE